MKLWLHDTRNPRVWLPRKYPGEEWTEEHFAEWTWVQTAGEAIDLLLTGQVQVLWCDHDLGIAHMSGTVSWSSTGSRRRLPPRQASSLRSVTY